MYKFEVRVKRDDSSNYNCDRIDNFVEYIEAEDAAEALTKLSNYKLIIAPADQD